VAVAASDLEASIAEDLQRGRWLAVDRDPASAEEVAGADLAVEVVEAAVPPPVVDRSNRRAAIRAVAGVVRLAGQRAGGRGCRRVLRAPRGLVDVDADADDDGAVGSSERCRTFRGSASRRSAI
jgi:hypothetical protein